MRFTRFVILLSVLGFGVEARAQTFADPFPPELPEYTAALRGQALDGFMLGPYRFDTSLRPAAAAAQAPPQTRPTRRVSGSESIAYVVGTAITTLQDAQLLEAHIYILDKQQDGSYVRRSTPVALTSKVCGAHIPDASAPGLFECVAPIAQLGLVAGQSYDLELTHVYTSDFGAAAETTPVKMPYCVIVIKPEPATGFGLRK